jgi:PAS domain S-box-containing protein
MPDVNSEAPPSKTKSAGDWLSELQKPEFASYWLAAIIESAEDAIVSKTLEGIITSWNKGAERLFGYTADEAIGQSVTMLIPSDHPDEEPGIISRIKRGVRVEHYETQRVRKDGAVIDVSLTVSPIRKADGTIIGASKIAREITERKLAEARLQAALRQAQEARTQAEEASRLKDEFLATVSHELRTPLTSMMGWIGMLRRGVLVGETASKALETIDRNVKSQAQLIEDLLDISRIVSGKMHVELKAIDPSTVINAAVDAIRPAAEAKGIRLQLITDPSTGPVWADSERLQQVIWNLISNAVKFTQRGGRVQIELERVDDNVEITVTDNGKGIKPEFLPFVFDRFSQADGTTTRAHGGLGVGLSIVKSIVELHGGTARATSEGEGKGTSVTVSLPVKEKPQQKRQPAKQPILGAISSTNIEYLPELAGLRILVVDDELDTCELVSTAFEQCGARVMVATSAAEALGHMHEWLPDVLIADISMPEMDGYELIQQVRAREPRAGGTIPAVALTAMARIEDRAKALASGYQMHVAKPVEMDELRAIIASLAGIVVNKH